MLLRDMNERQLKDHICKQKVYRISLEHPHKVWRDDEYQHYENVSRGILAAEDRLYELQGYPDAD